MIILASWKPTFTHYRVKIYITLGLSVFCASINDIIDIIFIILLKIKISVMLPTYIDNPNSYIKFTAQ